MAPVETGTTNGSNSLPLALFGGQVLLVTVLAAHVLLTARRAAQALPPSTRTRSQDHARRRHAIIFSIIALLSLASVSTFAFLWRFISYARWAEQEHYALPGTLWSGWYGTATDAYWRLGDWLADVNLVHEFSSVGINKPEGFLYTSQYFVGLLAGAIFMGAEGRRRNLSTSTISSFVLLSSLGSMGFAFSLFFVTILYTPLTLHRDDGPLHDALFTPSPVVYDLGIVASLLTLSMFPELISEYGDRSVLRLGYLVMPLAFAFAPQIIPVSLGRQHTSKAAAHRSYQKVFYVLSLTSFMLYWHVFIFNIFVNTPSKHSHVWDLFTNSHGKQNTNRLLTAISTTGQKLKLISKHPAISVTSLDVLFTTISLLAWTFTRDLDATSILESSVFSFLTPHHEKHVQFKEELARIMEQVPEPEAATLVETTTPKKRGRPSKKDAAINGASSAVSAASDALRRSTRRRPFSTDLDSGAGSVAGGREHGTGYDSDADSTYQPDEETRRAIAATEADGALTDGDIVHAGESTALAMFLTFAGGLGQLASSVLGAEVSGPHE
ncbi:hypothetical protein ACN47E_006530 [Coniothyrium glycines]